MVFTLDTLVINVACPINIMICWFCLTMTSQTLSIRYSCYIWWQYEKHKQMVCLLFFPRRQFFTFHTNHLQRRPFAWNVRCHILEQYLQMYLLIPIARFEKAGLYWICLVLPSFLPSVIPSVQLSEKVSSRFSQQLYRLQSWNLVHTYSVGLIFVCTGIRGKGS